MTIRRKLMLSFFAAALVIGVLGVLAFYRAMHRAEHFSVHEAAAVAQSVAALLNEYVDSSDRPDPRKRADLQEHILRLKEIQQRDIVIVDLRKRIIADAVPEEVGTVFDHDKGEEVGKTLLDGRLRTFVEISKAYPEGIRQIVLPLSSATDKRIGAVILEYTPLYLEILRENKLSAATFFLLFLAALALSLAIGYIMSLHLSRPLAALQSAAQRVAAGDLDVTVEQNSRDELGSLAGSFNKMTQALKLSRDWQLKAHSELVAEGERRERSEEALKASEQKFRALYENITDGIFILDREGNFIDMNRTAYERLGYSKEEMLSLNISQLNAPEFNALLEERKARIVNEGHAVFESAHRRKDGSVMPVEVNSRVLEFGGKTVLISAIRDITERLHADAELRKTNTLLRSLIQAIPDMVIFKDTEGRHVLVNRTVEELTGHPAKEIIGRTAEELMPPAEAEACRKSDEGALKASAPVHTDERLMKDGNTVYIDMVKAAMTDDRGSVTGLVAVGRDVTDRRRAEEVMRKSEEKYRELVESVNSIVLRWSGDGLITFINSFGANFFGYTAGELAGRHVVGSIVPGSESTGRDLTAMIQDLCRFPEHYSNNLNENMRKDGKHVWVSWTNKPVVDDEGRLVEILSIGNDMTERMQIQEELRRHREELVKLVEERTRELSESNEHLRREIADRERMEQELVKAQKLESLGVLAGGIAHDFNNLLTSTLGNISLALFDIDARHPAHPLLARAEHSTLRAQELTQQLLTFSRGGAPVKKTASIAELIRETAGFALRGGRVKCDFDLPDGLWLVDIDAGQISQVIHNLIINADHAMPGGGTISVRGENVLLPVPGGPSLPPGKYVKISVQDHGVGIPAEHLGKIFDPYFTTKQRGSGLGLATSYSIIQKHGGSISAESVLGKGTTFSLYLSASSATEEEVRADDTRLQRASGKVLIMDDEEDVRETAGSVLRRLGYSVVLAEDGSRALELYREAREAGEPFDVVIMDLTIPGGMGGRETLIQLHAIDPGARAIVSSGYSNDPVMANYEEYGFAGVVSKPFRIKELGRAVHQVLEKTRADGASMGDTAKD